MKKNLNEISIWDDEFDILNQITNSFWGVPNVSNKKTHRNNLMNTDIMEDGQNYKLEIDMPGIEKNDVNIQLKNGYITISCEKNTMSTQNDNSKNYLRRERYFGKAFRTFYVGDKIKEEDIDASLQHGVLKITIPKKVEIEHHKKIEIK